MAIITGGAGVLGRAIAARLRRDGYRLALWDRDAERLNAAVASAGPDAEAMLATATDITSPSEVRAALEVVLARWGRVDALVNNAGIEVPFDLSAPDLEVWDRTFDVNVRAAIVILSEVVPVWRRQLSGTMVSVGSRTWLSGSSPAPYVAAKAALVGLTRAVAAQLGPDGITANVVAPSFMRTPLNASRGDDDYFADYASRFADASALRRLIEPEDVAESIAFLVSPGARNITGEVLNVAAGSQLPPGIR